MEPGRTAPLRLERADVVGRPITEITVGPEDAEVAERIMATVRSIGSWEVSSG